MNEFFNNLKQEALNTKLSHQEKQSMRVSLYNAMKQTPAPAREVYTAVRVHSSYTWLSFISAPRFALPVAALLIMGLGTGTAFAAQGSLPGDTLYPIKINVTEPVEVALATTPAAKAQVEASIADRRVTEAQTLEAQGRLDATTTQELEDNFDEHASRALAFAGQEAATTTSVETLSVTAETSATTSDVTPSADNFEAQGPQTFRAAFKAASTAPPAPSSDVEISSASTSTAQASLSVSLKKQKDILNALKQRVSKHGRGSQSTNRGGYQNDATSTAAATSTDVEAAAHMQFEASSSQDTSSNTGYSNNDNRDQLHDGQNQGGFVRNFFNHF